MAQKLSAYLVVNVFLIMGVGCKADWFAAAEESTPYAMGYEENRFLLADSQETLDDVGNLYVTLFKTAYERNINKLENYRQGEVAQSRRPYSDGWFPEANGGTNSNRALDRYDAAFNGGTPKASEWENQNHADTVSWYGHCNGFSVAASRHQNPGRSVYRPVGCQSSGNCVEFEPKHIRALMAEVYMSAKNRFLGGTRCKLPKNQISNNPQDRLDPLVMDACDDLDPGSFHVALINFIGIQKQVLIYDQSRDEQVWNFPLYKYSYTLGNNGRRLNRAQAASLVGRRGATDYVFNPKAVAFVQVAMRVHHAKALYTSLETQAAPTQDVAIDYSYLLELDAQENIIGGEWLGNSRADHPDFIWFPFEPFDSPDDRRYGNPHVKASNVIAMWAESMGFDTKDPFSDPKNPNRILMSPVDTENFGKHEPFFTATIDGTNTGGVFLGKRAHLRITRLPKLHGEATLDLILNGAPLGSVNVTGTQGINYEFDSPEGMNTLEFKWRLGNSTPEGANVTFRYYSMR